MLLALWPAGRRFALLPLLGILLPFASALSLRMGAFLKASALEPHRHRCGLPFAIPLAAIVSFGIALLVAGGLLTLHPLTRIVGKQMLIRFFPLYVAVCILSLVAGRYVL